MDNNSTHTGKRRRTEHNGEPEHTGGSEAWRRDPQVGAVISTIRARTVELTLPRLSSPYIVDDFITCLQNANVHPQDIDAIGPYKSNCMWHICFIDTGVYNHVLSLKCLNVKSQIVNIVPVNERTMKLRIHWAQFWVPDEAIISALNKENIQVANHINEVYPGTNIKTMVRIYTVLAQSPSEIPYIPNLEDEM